MRNLTTLLTITLLAFPISAAAEDRETMEDKLGSALRQMLEDMRPALDDALDETLKFFGAFEAIDDPRHYQLPEVLPNGDIIIRRRGDAPSYPPPPDDPAHEDNDTVDL